MTSVFDYEEKPAAKSATVVPWPGSPEPDEALRLLILTSSTGSGHDRRAYAVQQWMDELYGARVEVRVEHILEKEPGLTRFGVRLYNFVQRHAPLAHHFYWWIVEFFGLTQPTLLRCFGRSWKELVRAWRPHLILSVHDCTNRGYFDTAKRVLGEEAVKCVTYCGEYTGGHGFSRHWVSRAADVYYARTIEAGQWVQLDRGVPLERCRQFGPLLPPALFRRELDEAEREAFLREELGFSPDRLTLVLGTGALGANRHLDFLQVLLARAPDVQVIAVCGRCEATLRRLRVWQRLHPELALYLEGYSDRLDRFLQVSDAVVLRGGSNLATEALWFGCLPLFDAVVPAMPQEALTQRYFLRHHAGLSLRSADDLGRAVDRWLREPSRLEARKAALQALRPTEAPASFVRELYELGREAQARSAGTP